MADTKAGGDSQGSLRRALEHTVPSEQFSARAVRKAMEQTASDRTPEETAGQFLLRTRSDSAGPRLEESAPLTHFGDSTVVPAELVEAPPGDLPRQRYELLSQAGAGATGRVYVVRDRSLDRTVAVKFLRRSREERQSVRQRFVHEARITGRLEHPNIMPVHDVGVTEGRELFYVMKHVTGVSLGDAIRQAREGRDVPGEFATTDGRVRILLKLCDAVAFAHSRGIIHQDIKPDNVMLGEYGEVLLVDWGSALTHSEAAETEGRALYGTPAYMSPEQARRDRADERSDIYCLGATFFHALLLRHPVWADDPETFWEKKRAGTLDPVAFDERHRAPSALIDIALKAMAPDPAQRYQSAAQLADELKRYQAGLAVKAHRESPVESFVRWYHHNRRLFWAIAAGVFAVSAVGTILLREKVKEMLTWRPVFTEDFSTATTATLAKRWNAYTLADWYTPAPDTFGDTARGFRVHDGALRGTQGNGAYDISYRHEISGDLRIEWTVTPLVGTDNMNCFVGGPTRQDGYTFHVDGYGLKGVVTLTRGATGLVLQRGRHHATFEEGRGYRLRMEREGRHVRLFVDGVRVVDYADPDILTGVGHQTFGFDVSQYKTLAIDDLKVYHHPLPLRVSPLVAPDQFFDDGQYAKALVRYVSLRDGYPGSDVAAVAQYRIGRCLFRLDSLDKALAALERFEREYPRHELIPYSVHERAKLLEAQGRLPSADSVLLGLARRYPRHPVVGAILTRLEEQGRERLQLDGPSYGLDAQASAGLVGSLDRLRLRVRELSAVARLPMAENLFLAEAAQFFWRQMGILADSLAGLFPEQRKGAADCLRDIGDVERLVRDYPDQASVCAPALGEVGAYDYLLRELPGQHPACASALHELGRYAEVLTLYPKEGSSCAASLLGLGRYDEVLQDYADQKEQAAEALWRLGRYEECLERYPATPLGRSAASLLHRLPRYYQLVRNDITELNNYYINATYSYDSAIADLPHWRVRTVVSSYQWACYYRYRESGRSAEVRRNDQVNAERRVSAHLDVGDYEGLRERYPLHRIAEAQILLAQGHYDSLLAHCSYHVASCIQALQRSGRYEDVIRRYPLHRLEHARSLMMARQYERVVREYPDQHGPCAEALRNLGREAEVVAGYPDQRLERFRALLSVAGPDSALAAYAEYRSECADWLLAHGRWDELERLVPDERRQRAVSLLMRGRPWQVLTEWPGYRLSRLARHQVLSLLAVEVWTGGRRRAADSLLAVRPTVYVHRSDVGLRLDDIALGPFLHALSGRRAALDSLLAVANRAHRYTADQRLWYEVSFVAGEIDSAAFMSQPHRHRAAERLTLLKGLREDLAGDRDAALAAYQSAASQPSFGDISDSWALKRLRGWRMGAVRR